MTKYIFLLNCILLGIGCQQQNNNIHVKSIDELQEVITDSQPGDEIELANGVWNDLQLEVKSSGTRQNPITIRAETPGQVFIEGRSYIKLGGEYIVIKGLYFRNGFTPEKSIIQFKIGDDQVANNCKVTECVIKDFNQPHRDKPDHWIEFWGRNNQLESCYIAGKANQGPTIRVYINGNENIKNYHQIVNNHFGPRPRKGGPRAETMQIGDSGTSMSPSHTLVKNNLFDRCNGEVEVISSKTNFNEFRNNIFYKCEGSLVMRHGNYCIIDGNYFIGEDASENIGGIRIINTGHRVTNNYFYNLKGKEFRSPLAIMNGIPRSPLNRYNQVTDVVVAHNTWINCTSPWQFGVGSNVSQSEVLPPSEIRSARPIRTLVANNLIYNEIGDPDPIVCHDKIDGIVFENNIIDNQRLEFKDYGALEVTEVGMEKIAGDIFIPDSDVKDKQIYDGFEFENIDVDLFGNNRKITNSIGAYVGPESFNPFETLTYGPSWFSPYDDKKESTVYEASPGDLMEKIKLAQSGDSITLLPGTYNLDNSIIIAKEIHLLTGTEPEKVKIIYTGSPGTALFEMHPGGDLNLTNLWLIGERKQYAFSTLKNNMNKYYNLSVENTSIESFDYVLKAYKESFADSISFKQTIFKDCNQGIELSEETNDRGDYNVEFLTIDQCKFENIDQNVIDYYRGGYDESTIGGNLLVTNSTFTKCGSKEENGILLNTRGIVNVEITNNTFDNNPVKLVALLWGAKNNSHKDNTIKNSGKIVVEENLKLKLMY